MPNHSNIDNPLKNFETAKYASKTHGLIISYAANTHQGIQRSYNEDRVSIILNMTKP
jgi:protein phosphatase PTC2/3